MPGLVLKGKPMPQIQSALSSSSAQVHLSRDEAKRPRKHLRPIYRMTHEQQVALIEEARAARLREQNRSE
jgi:hypothetical protein